MSAPDGFDVTAFDLGDAIVFKHYFGSGELYEGIAEHYDADEYRYEVPPDEFAAVREALADHGYAVTVVEEPAPYCVVVEQYEPHATILRASVAHWTRRGHEFFLMPTVASVETAVREGATPVEETDLAAGI